jgi:ATP-binding cassette subfamily B protein
MAAYSTSTRLFDGLMYQWSSLGRLFLLKGKITAGDLVAYVLYVSTLILTIRRIVDYAEHSSGHDGIERFLQIIDARGDRRRADAKPIVVTHGEIVSSTYRSNIPTTTTGCCARVNLTDPRWGNLALVGPSVGQDHAVQSDPRFS